MTGDKVKVMNRKGSSIAELYSTDVYLCFHKKVEYCLNNLHPIQKSEWQG